MWKRRKAEGNFSLFIVGKCVPKHMALQTLSWASESSQFVDFSSILASVEKPQSDVAWKLLILPVYRRLTFSYVNLQFDVIEKSSFNELFL